MSDTIIDYEDQFYNAEEFRKIALKEKLHNELISNPEVNTGLTYLISEFSVISARNFVNIGDDISISTEIKAGSYDIEVVHAFMVFMELKGFKTDFNPNTGVITVRC